MKMVYDEWYGELSYAQRAAYKRYNVSPSDHDDLMDMFRKHPERGTLNEHVWATEMVKRYSEEHGMFSVFDMRRGEGHKFGVAGMSPFERF